jgi:hypothetical protein
MMGVLALSLVFLMADEPSVPTDEAPTVGQAPAAKPRKSLRKGSEAQTEEANKKPSADDEAPTSESDRPIPKPGEELNPLSETDEKLDEELGQELEAAENPDQDPVSRIAEGMKQSEEKLAQRQGNDETIGLQEKIVKDLEELLAQAENPPPPSGGGKGAKKKSNQKQQQEMQKQRQTASRQQNSRKSSQSSERIGPARPAREELTPQQGERNVWGHLSELMREEMGQYAKENFLVKYRDLIERYYTDIAKQSSSR